MRIPRACLTYSLVGLLFVFSFNAYACLLPVDGGAHMTHGSDCSTPGKEPPRQVCDLFKVFALHAWADPEPTSGDYDTYPELLGIYSVLVDQTPPPVPYPLVPIPRPAQKAPLLLPVLRL